MLSIPAPQARCAWQGPGSDTCGRVASSPCAHCHLVVYCDKECQRKHWPEHKKACKSPLSRSSWRPVWDIEGREPVWAAAAATRGHNPFGGNHYLWGNVPAIDILQLEQHEGNTSDPIHLFFAASGDLRNVVQTVVGLPELLHSKIYLVVNDRDFDVVGRNALLMLYLLVSLHDCPDENTLISLAESLIHLWYSALLPERLSLEFKSKVQPLIHQAYKKIRGMDRTLEQEYTWNFRSACSFRLVLSGQNWLRLAEFWDGPSRLSKEKAMEVRASVILNSERRDCRDRWYFKDHSRPTRVAKEKFRREGVLLPFGQACVGFTVPNPTLFQSSHAWPMDDKSDPLNGWPLWEVQRWKWPAKEDSYGKLFSYLAVKFAKFLQRLTALDMHFHLHCNDAVALSKTLEQAKFARIELANIADAGYLGIRDTLRHMVPLLQTAELNAHATLITLFLNAVAEIAVQGQSDIPDIGAIFEVLGTPDISRTITSQSGAEMYRVWDARTYFYDVERLFSRYMALHQFENISTASGVIMKSENTIVEAWPFQRKLRTRDSEARKETQILLGSNFSGLEHYAEWQRGAGLRER